MEICSNNKQKDVWTEKQNVQAEESEKRLI